MSLSPYSNIRVSPSAQQIEQCKQILKGLNPQIPENECEKIAKRMASQSAAIANASQNQDEYKENATRLVSQAMKSLPPSAQAFLDNTLRAYDEESKKVIESRNLNLQQSLDPNQRDSLNTDLLQASLKSIEKAKALEAKEAEKHYCKVCRVSDLAPNSTTVLQKCGRCFEAVYCSKECQKRDWTAHKIDCLKK